MICQILTKIEWDLLNGTIFCSMQKQHEKRGQEYTAFYQRVEELIPWLTLLVGMPGD